MSNSHSEQIKEAAAEEDFDIYAEADKAAEDLAQAFATIEKLRNYIPARIYSQLADSISEFIHIAPWSSTPEIMVKSLPPILRAAILRDWEETPV